jgi:hypothetical protein
MNPASQNSTHGASDPAYPEQSVSNKSTPCSCNPIGATTPATNPSNPSCKPTRNPAANSARDTTLLTKRKAGSAGTQPAGGIVKNRGDGSRPPNSKPGGMTRGKPRARSCPLQRCPPTPGIPSLCPCLKKSRGPGQSPALRRGTIPRSHDHNGNKTRYQRGNPSKITRSKFGNHERCQFGI